MVLGLYSDELTIRKKVVMKRYVHSKGSNRPGISRIRLTAFLGLILIVASSIGLMWILGVIAHEVPSMTGTQRSMHVSADCELDTRVNAEFELLSFDTALFEIHFDLPERHNEKEQCNRISVSTSHEVTMNFSVGGPKYSDSSDRKHIKPNPSLSVERQDGGDDMNWVFDISLDTEEPIKSVFSQFTIVNPVDVHSLSEGEVNSTFFFDNLSRREDNLSFIVILHHDIRMTARDLGASLDDPRNPNVYRYQAVLSPIQPKNSVGETRYVGTNFSIQIPDKERLKETLLVILSALFGVGVSALFESLLASQIYATLASGLFRTMREEHSDPQSSMSFDQNVKQGDTDCD